jgi:hypothetical protein
MMYLERFEGERLCPNQDYYAAICQEGLKKTTSNFSQVSRSSGRDSNRAL